MHTIHAGHPVFARDARAAWSRLSAVMDLPSTEDTDDFYPKTPARPASALSLRAPLKPGHYLALQTIFLPAPFSVSVIPVATSFDVLAINGDRARIHYAGLREWVSCSALQGRALSVMDKVVGEDGFTMVPVTEAG